MADDEGPTDARQLLGTTRLEAFSDGVFSIAITLLVLDIAIRPPGSPLEQVLDAWPSYLAYVVSFLTIGAAWLAHTAITDRLVQADPILLRLNLLMLLVVAFLPFPTRLVSEALHDVDAERVFATMYGLTLLGIRVSGFVLDEYARHENLYAAGPESEELRRERRTLLPAIGGYLIAIVVGLFLPRAAVGLYCVLSIYLVVPFRTVARLLFPRPD
jgi:uncharacterized membrane protein